MRLSKPIVAAAALLLVGCSSDKEGDANKSVAVADLRSAFAAATQCMEQRGISITSAELTERSDASLSVSLVYADPGEAGATVEDDCRKSTGFDDLLATYQQQHAPTRQDQERLVGLIVECLEAAGHPLPAGEDPGMFVGRMQQEAVEVWGTCVSEAQSEVQG